MNRTSNSTSRRQTALIAHAMAVHRNESISAWAQSIENVNGFGPTVLSPHSRGVLRG
jgi:hypothetical protein